MPYISKINLNENVYEIKDTYKWVGTEAELEAAIERGEIKEGMLIYVTDDYVDEQSFANYYTKAEVNELLANLAIPTLNVEPVDSIDDVTSPSPSTIYLVPGEDGSGVMYREYIYNAGNWKLLGTQKTVTTTIDDETGKLYLNT